MIHIKLDMQIDLGAIRSNLSAAREKCGRIYLMLKADAYGHGLREVALAVRDIADGYAVATIEEGVSAAEALRECGYYKEIIVCDLSYDEVESAVGHGLTVGISNDGILSEAIRLSDSGKRVVAHIKLDTGMRRLGFCEDELPAALDRLAKSRVNVVGVYSHMGSDAPLQKMRFERMSQQVLERYPNAIRHLAASPTMENERYRYDAVRIGLAAYLGAMSVQSKVLSSRRAYAGDRIGYSPNQILQDTFVATVFGGYADGIPREGLGAYMLIRGRKCKILNVCMDMTIVDTGDFLADVGEVVTVVDAKTMTSIADLRNTTPYTVMTGFNGRVERRYLH